MGDIEWIRAPAYNALGPPSLEILCYRSLVNHRNWLGDLGDIPLVLVHGILEVCSVEQLILIEDETRLGGRDIGTELSPYWKRHLIEKFGLEALPTDAEHNNEGSTDWRSLYEWRWQEYEERTQALGQRLRHISAKCAEQKSSRTMQVLQKAPRRQCARTSARFAAPPPSSRNRLLKKLGMRAPPAQKAGFIKPVKRRVPQALASEPPAKWAAPTAQGVVLVECDLDLPGSGGATSPVQLAKEYAMLMETDIFS
ncbi:hypothetical protein WJX75_005972 [Coccomyxa subellipsoidea]|uniref:Uncharacterized protein n=1 Tax=Coccomyxa subellipsoidea TaxID=248742 RepID=A0ABR2YBJ8_9CHLO